MPARDSYAIIGQDSLRGVIPPTRSQSLGTTYLVHVSAHSTKTPLSPTPLILAAPLKPKVGTPLSEFPMPLKASHPSSNNMPRRASTTYGRHTSTPIPSAPLAKKLCLFMRCVDWFRPASGSSGKRLQLSYPVHLL